GRGAGPAPRPHRGSVMRGLRALALVVVSLWLAGVGAVCVAEPAAPATTEALARTETPATAQQVLVMLRLPSPHFQSARGYSDGAGLAALGAAPAGDWAERAGRGGGQRRGRQPPGPRRPDRGAAGFRDRPAGRGRAAWHRRRRRDRCAAGQRGRDRGRGARRAA